MVRSAVQHLNPAGIRHVQRYRLHEPLLICISAIAAFAIALLLGRGTTFWFDEWRFLLKRDELTIDTLFRPHNDHPAPLLVIFYNALMRLIGLDHYVAYRSVAHAFHIAVALMIYFYVRRLLPFAGALAIFVVLASYGPGYENILWAFQLGWTGSLAFGFAALVLTSSQRRSAYLIMAFALLLSISMSSLGLLFVLGIAVKSLLTRRGALLAACLPAAVAYAVWFLLFYDFYVASAGERYGFDYSLPVQLMNLPQFVMVMWAHAAAGAIGLLSWQLVEAQTAPPAPSPWGVVLLALAATLAGSRLFRRYSSREGAGGGQQARAVATLTSLSHPYGRFSRLRFPLQRGLPRKQDDAPASALAVAAMLVFFSVLVGIGRSFFDRPSSSRYLYVTVCFFLVLAAHALSGPLTQQKQETRRLASFGLVATAVFACVANLGVLRRGAIYFRAQASHTRAVLYFLDLARPFLPATVVAERLFEIRAGDYYRVRDKFGSPVAGPSSIMSESDALRVEVDQLLIRNGALLVGPIVNQLKHQQPASPTSPTDAAPTNQSRNVKKPPPATALKCRTSPTRSFTPQGGGPAAVTTVALAPGSSAFVRARTPVRVAARVFGPRDTVVGSIAEGAVARISPRRIALDQPWTVVLSSDRRFTVCSYY